MNKQPLPSVTLAIMHNICLTREQRYDLHAGSQIQVVGVQVPVWHRYGYSSEPAIEIFCRYVLHNDSDSGMDIIMTSWGYEFNLPQASRNDIMPDIDLSDWRAMTREQQDEWYDKYPQRPTSKNLLDVKDGGSESIAFNQRTIVIINNVPANVLHYVRIDTMESLKKSLA